MTTTGLRGYARSIAAAIGSTDPALLALVEGFMRLGVGTLDALSAARFTALARRALNDVATWHAVGTIDGCALSDYCATMSLDYPSEWPREVRQGMEMITMMTN